MNPSYPITTSLKEDVYEKQKSLRERINPKTNKKFTLPEIVEAGVDRLNELS